MRWRSKACGGDVRCGPGGAGQERACDSAAVSKIVPSATAVARCDKVAMADGLSSRGRGATRRRRRSRVARRVDRSEWIFQCCLENSDFIGTGRACVPFVPFDDELLSGR
jgi:hypothetical protein